MRIALGESLKSLGHDIVFTASGASSFLAQARLNHIEIALLDVHLGSGLTGIDVAHKIREIYPEMGLVFLTSFADPRLVSSANTKLPRGSVYVEKSKIESIQEIKSAIDSSKSEGKKDTINSGSELGFLTNKQIEVLRLIASGLSNSQIARELSSTTKNIEGVISRIIKGLGLRDIETQNQRVHMARTYFRYRGVKLDE